jgi:hypothetical protein
MEVVAPVRHSARMGHQDRPEEPPAAQDRLRLADSLLHAVQESLVPLQRLVTEAREALGPALPTDDRSPRDAELAALRREVEQLRAGMVSRSVIERAKGMLMQGRGLSESQAFELLNATSQQRHRKLRDVANDVVNGAVLSRLAVVPDGQAAPDRPAPHVHREARGAGSIE